MDPIPRHLGKVIDEIGFGLYHYLAIFVLGSLYAVDASAFFALLIIHLFSSGASNISINFYCIAGIVWFVLKRAN